MGVGTKQLLFRPQAKKEYTANKHCTKTMGLATVNTHEPTGFLKKQNRSQSDQQQAGQSKVFFHFSANQRV